MSMNVYLDWTKKDDSRLEGLSPTVDKTGCVFLALNDEANIPGSLWPFVEKITICQTIPVEPARERGFYKLGRVEGQVEFNDQFGVRYRIFVTGQNLDEITELLQAIKGGTLRPEISYEKPQLGKSRKRLLEDLADLQSQYDNLRADWENGERRLHDVNLAHEETRRDLEQARRELVERREEVKQHKKVIGALLQLAADLVDSRWPICFKKSVADRICDSVGAPPQ